MALRPMVFPATEVAAAGLLERQNRDMQAAVSAASFVEGLSLIDAQSRSYSGIGTHEIVRGSLNARAGQYVMFFGSVIWTADTAAASANLQIFIDGNNTKAFSFSAAQKGTSSGTEVAMLPFQYVYKVARAKPSFVVSAEVSLGGSGALTPISLGYFRLAGAPT
jgi:hypothetical protein